MDKARNRRLPLVPDITKVESYRNTLDSTITGVIHTAVPFVLDNLMGVPSEMLDPAIQGYVSILEAAEMYGKSVCHVVTTASFTSNFDMFKGLRPEYTYTENDWNPTPYVEASTAPLLRRTVQVKRRRSEDSGIVNRNPQPQTSSLPSTANAIYRRDGLEQTLRSI